MIYHKNYFVYFSYYYENSHFPIIMSLIKLKNHLVRLEAEFAYSTPHLKLKTRRQLLHFLHIHPYATFFSFPPFKSKNDISLPALHFLHNCQSFFVPLTWKSRASRWSIDRRTPRYCLRALPIVRPIGTLLSSIGETSLQLDDPPQA